MTHPIAASREVKTIRKRIKQIGVELSHLNDENAQIRKAIGDKNRTIQKLKERLKELEGVDLEVTDHAILRYLERTAGLDVEALKAEILNDRLRAQVNTLGGTGKFPGPNHTLLVLENKRVVTVLPGNGA